MDDRHLDADVVVVGGGPAGSAAAIACAARGLRVVLCEREHFDRARPGETFHPGIEPLLAQLGVADRLAPVIGARHAGIFIEWGGPRRFASFGADDNGPWRGFQVWRADFDTLLLARARDAGVDVRQPCGAGAVIRQECGLCGVRTTHGSITARMLVDASGRWRWLGRRLGLQSPRRSPPLYARYGYAQGLCPERAATPALVGDAAGWTWTARVRPDTYQWTRLSFAGQPDVDWFPEEFRRLTPLGRSRGADVTWRLASEPAGPGWFIVGDAAAALDPASSHGVLRALMSGIAAAHLIAALLAGKLPAAATAAAYRDWLADWFAVDAQQLAQFYRELGVAIFQTRLP